MCAPQSPAVPVQTLRSTPCAWRMSTILPKGIVVNHPGVGRDIEKIDREPLAPEEIAKLWKGEPENGPIYSFLFFD